GHPHDFAAPSLLSAIQPAIADLDDDGVPEVLAVTNQGYPIALRADGSTIWESPVQVYEPGPNAHWYLHQSAIAVHDLDADGSPEILVGLTVLEANGDLVFRDPTQADEFGFEPEIFYLWIRPTAADLDGDGTLEVLFGYVTYNADGTER